MSPNTRFPPDNPLDSPIVERILGDPSVVYDVSDHSVVIAMRSDLVVHRSLRAAPDEFDRALTAVARPVGTLASLTEPPTDADGRARYERATTEPPPGLDGAAAVELWRLTDPQLNAIDEARRLRRLAPEATLRTRHGQQLTLPAVSPNHVSIVSSNPAGCPAGPPHPTTKPYDADTFILPLHGDRPARVVVIDTGYIRTHPPHVELDRRVTSVAGQYLDSHVTPARWKDDLPDEITTDPEGRLHEIVGHGTFVAGLIAHLCTAAAITSVGQRDQDILIDGESAPEQKRLFSSEVALAHALLTHGGVADVVQLGFSFPTLDDYPSLPFAHVMAQLSGPDAPTRGIAVVSPAGNEMSAAPYWPAALPDVIGVGATNRRGRSRAWFSNWGPWLNCCARGEDLVSTYIHWSGRVEGEHPSHEIERFRGWARWDGTSFAAPQVSAAIARVLAANEGMRGTEAFDLLLQGSTNVQVTQVTDQIPGQPPVTLPELHVH